jgi:hypothetical protein
MTLTQEQERLVAAARAAMITAQEAAQRAIDALKPTAEEDNSVTDSLYDQAHDCAAECWVEDATMRLEELLQVREMNEEVALADAEALTLQAESAGDVPDVK